MLVIFRIPNIESVTYSVFIVSISEGHDYEENNTWTFNLHIKGTFLMHFNHPSNKASLRDRQSERVW